MNDRPLRTGFLRVQKNRSRITRWETFLKLAPATVWLLDWNSARAGNAVGSYRPINARRMVRRVHNSQPPLETSESAGEGKLHRAYNRRGRFPWNFRTKVLDFWSITIDSTLETSHGLSLNQTRQTECGSRLTRSSNLKNITDNSFA